MSSTVSATTTTLNGIPAQQGQPAADKPQHRLVPARVGNQTIYIECPRWCSVDHADEPVNHLEDATTHYSGGDVVQVLTLLDDDTAHSELYATISSDPSSADPRLRTGHIVINDGASTDAYLTPDMGEQLAADLDVFAAQLRAQAATARAHNEVQA